MNQFIRALTARDVMTRLLLAAVLASLAFFAWVSSSGSASASVRTGNTLPYTDPSSVGSLTLCGKDGSPLTTGNVNDRPFAWRAVAGTAAPAPYNAAGRTATLFAYQPREGVDPGQWSGDMLTASAKYSNADRPMAQATRADISLADFLDGYPAQWDGLVQLRIYLGAPNTPTLTSSYTSADIKVDGDQWQLVQGGTSAADCTSGNAISLEALLPAATMKKLAKGGSAPSGSSSTSQHAGASSKQTDGAIAAPAEEPAATTASTGSPGPRWWLPVGIAVAVLVALLALLVARGSRGSSGGRHA